MAAHSKKNYYPLFFTLAVLTVILGAGIWRYVSVKQQYRAVFLSNNQVYFGHFVWWPLAGTVTLSDIYYLQLNTPLQQGEAQPTEQSMKIVKFGNELHGPKDRMFIPKNQILFWEDLRDNSPVVQNIKERKN